MRNALALFLGLCIPVAASAAELHVLCAGAVRSAVEALLPAYEARSGDHVLITYDTMGGLLARLAAGEPADLIIGTREALANLAAKGALAAEPTPLGAVGIGVAVRDGSARPDISSVAALKATLLAAKSVVYVDPTKGTSGRYVAAMMTELGIADEMKAKTRTIDGGYVLEAVAKGEAEIGLQQISEILPVKGVTLIGPLPPPLQKTTIYAAAVTSAAKAAAAAGELLRELMSSGAAAVLKSKGLEAPR